MSVDHVLIIGAGMAGASAAAKLRGAGHAGGITLVGEEQRLPYDRPPLSKEVLLGRARGGDALILPEDFYRKERIDVRLGSQVTSLDLDARAAVCEGGARIHYDQLVIATGARARRLHVPGITLPGVCYLRSVEDASLLSESLHAARRLVVIGGGFIGLEVASAARHLGVEVVIVEQAPTCLERVMPSAAVSAVIGWHCERGVSVLCNRTVQVIEGRSRVESVTLDDGTQLEADLVVVGIGSVANDELARKAGIACARGVLVDTRCRTSVDRVFAIGDVASIRDASTGRGRRLESWDNAGRQAARVAEQLMDRTIDQNNPPWFWSDQYGHNVQIVGLPSEQDIVYVRPGADQDHFIQLYFRQGSLTGAVLFNSGRERNSLARLIGRPADPRRLTDQSLPLKQAGTA